MVTNGPTKIGHINRVVVNMEKNVEKCMAVFARRPNKVAVRRGFTVLAKPVV